MHTPGCPQRSHLQQRPLCLCLLSAGLKACFTGSSFTKLFFLLLFMVLQSFLKVHCTSGLQPSSLLSFQSHPYKSLLFSEEKVKLSLGIPTLGHPVTSGLGNPLSPRQDQAVHLGACDPQAGRQAGSKLRDSSCSSCLGGPHEDLAVPLLCM